MPNSFLWRCSHCNSLNKILTTKIDSKPKCGSCKKEIIIPRFGIDVNSGDFSKEVYDHPGPVLVDFWSPYCGHCVRLNPVLDEIAQENRGVLKVAKVNTHVEQHLAAQFGIRGIPNLYLFNKGKKVNEISGALPKNQLLSWIKNSVNI